MHYVLALLGIVGAFAMIIKREMIGDLIGDAEWMGKVGGVYNLVVILAALIFFWSIATLTGTTGVFFKPLLWLIPGRNWDSAPAEGF